jgi:hypothetical protein
MQPVVYMPAASTRQQQLVQNMATLNPAAASATASAYQQLPAMLPATALQMSNMLPAGAAMPTRLYAPTSGMHLAHNQQGAYVMVSPTDIIGSQLG